MSTMVLFWEGGGIYAQDTRATVSDKEKYKTVKVLMKHKSRFSNSTQAVPFY